MDSLDVKRELAIRLANKLLDSRYPVGVGNPDMHQLLLDGIVDSLITGATVQEIIEELMGPLDARK